MKISHNSWHYRYYRFCHKAFVWAFEADEYKVFEAEQDLDEQENVNLCPYFWHMFFGSVLVIWQFFFWGGLGFLFYQMILQPYGFYGVASGVISLTAILTVAILFVSIPWMVRYVTNALTKRHTGETLETDHTGVRELIRERYRSYKQKYCPIIEVDRNE